MGHVSTPADDGFLASRRDAADDTKASTGEVVELVMNALLVASEEGDYRSEIHNVRTYDDAGLMTSDDGVVLYLADGSQFQLTIVRSR